MLQVARLAPKQLDQAASKVEQYLQGQFNPDGGAQDRSGDSDLYYTVFVLEGLLALQAQIPQDKVAEYLKSFGSGADLDLVHLCCLARCWASLQDHSPEQATRQQIASNLDAFRSLNGGFNAEPGEELGTIYEAFLAFGAYQDLNTPCGELPALADSILALQSKDGAFANLPNLALGSTTVSAAAVTLLRHLDRPAPENIGNWLLSQAHPEGGFLAAPGAPLPDLLSTATCLHALASLQVDFSRLREHCLDFVDSLWTGQAFCGHWAEEVADSEYTYYGLLALGHLSL
ncbi:MAG: prenyltransferase/squalene oxidase repeat-containing protein [Planctomycetota bacterium]|jgi:prenyltransferase beta subunit